MNSTYLTLMGRSGWAVINSYYATVLETEHEPDRVILFYESQYADTIEKVKRGIEIIQGSYCTPNIAGIEVPTSDIDTIAQAVRDSVTEEKARNAEIILDITGGRKALVVGSLLAMKHQGPDHVYYLDIETTQGVAKPYLMIPLKIQKLLDLYANEVKTESIEFGPESSPRELYLHRNEIQLVLNQSYRRSEDIILSAPLIDMDLFRLDVDKNEITNLIDFNEYKSNIEKYGQDGFEHPDYFDLCRSLCYCGILDYENAEEISELLVDDIAKTHTYVVGIRKAVLALDSNMFYNGFPSYLESLEQEHDIRPKEILCVTPYPVIQEIQNRIAAKYRQGHIKEAKDKYESPRVKELLDQFVNQNTLQTRIAKMARSELSKFMDRPAHQKTSIVTVPNDKERVDTLIVEELEKFARSREVRVTLLSADKNMLDHCKTATDVGGLVPRLTSRIPYRIEVSETNMIDLMVTLSLLYGVIEISPIGYQFGEYGGKQAEVYSEEVKLLIQNKDRAKILENRLDTCRRLDRLKIAK